MKYLLDTMVISEPAKPRPNAGVIAWLEAQDTWDFAVSVLTFGEIQRGVDRMPDGRRRLQLQTWLSSELRDRFADNVLGVDLDVALAWGTLTTESERLGRPLHVIDGLLLATAKVHGLVVVTRNVTDFSQRGVPVHNPFD